MTDKRLQWHPAFIAAMQIDFGEEADRLIFLSELELNKMPMRIDALVIKKNGSEPLKKNMGRLLKGHNIFEYKSPEDTLNIDDFYKVYGYACFYKSNSEQTNAIKQDDITITFVCSRYPRKMLEEVTRFRKLEVRKTAPGIYYLEGDPFPIQILISKELSPEENRWLGSLRTDLQPDQNLNVLLEDYEKHKDSRLYQAAMDLIVRANPAAMEEARSMCEALHELWAEDLEKATKEIAKEITKEVTEEVTNKVTKEVTNKVTKEVTNKVTKEVTNKVTKEVTRNDILLFVEILLEDGYGESTVCEKLHQKFHLKKEDIQDYIQQVRNRSN